MDSFSASAVLKILADFGTLGVVIFLWWSDNKLIWKVIGETKKSTDAMLEQYRNDMQEQREMYKNNVILCQDFSEISKDLRAIVTLNIQKMTEIKDEVKNNQFCPLVRVDRRKIMPLSDLFEEDSARGTHE